VYGLSEERFQTEAAPVLHQIFARASPYDRPFAPDVEVRRLLYPIGFDLMRLDKEVPPLRPTPLFSAVVSAAKTVGDTGFYVSILETIVPPEPGTFDHWFVPFDELDKYDSLGSVTVLEPVLYSPNGRWGIMTCHEDHALFGGTPAFFDAIRRIIPGFDDIKQLQRFLSDWKYYATRRGADVSWVPDFLAHIYGAETAQHLLAEAGFADLLDSG
jgi:hypothetical protein